MTTIARVFQTKLGQMRMVASKKHKDHFTSLKSEVSQPLVYGLHYCYCLTIIPRARMGSESIVHEAEGRMGY